jgi:hypothetical protein
MAIAIIKTAALFVNDNFLIVGVPPVIAIWVGILWIWWIISAMYCSNCIYNNSYIVSCGKVEGQGTTPFATVVWDDTTRHMFWYWVFGGLWKNAFLQALC